MQLLCSGHYIVIPSNSDMNFVIAGLLEQVLATAVTDTLYSMFGWRVGSVASVVDVIITSVDSLSLTRVISTLYVIVAPIQVVPSHRTT